MDLSDRNILLGITGGSRGLARPASWRARLQDEGAQVAGGA